MIIAIQSVIFVFRRLFFFPFLKKCNHPIRLVDDVIKVGGWGIPIRIEIGATDESEADLKMAFVLFREFFRFHNVP